MIELKSISKLSVKLTSYLLLVVLNLHALSFHAFAETLVYCFEENGDVNVESTIDFGIGISSKDDLHEEKSHDHDASVIHQNQENHHDLAVSLLCSKDDRVNRFDQKRVVSNLQTAVYQQSEIIFPSRFDQSHSFIPLKIENPETTRLKTVVLLN